MVLGMLDPGMIEDAAKIVNEAQKDKVQIYLIQYSGVLYSLYIPRPLLRRRMIS
jgi:hypothetical protein